VSDNDVVKQEGGLDGKEDSVQQISGSAAIGKCLCSHSDPNGLEDACSSVNRQVFQP